MATLRRIDLDDGVEPDSSFYIAHEREMRVKRILDLTVDPPPDLAIEVEVTRRLGARKTIYRELGVPGSLGLQYERLGRPGQTRSGVCRGRSEPDVSAALSLEITNHVTAGLTQDDTTFAKAFRRRVQEVIAGA